MYIQTHSAFLKKLSEDAWIKAREEGLTRVEAVKGVPYGDENK